MKDLIRKILKEEMDSDWDFMDDIDEFDHFVPKTGERYIWKNYRYGTDEIEILGHGGQFLHLVNFTPIIPKEGYGEDATTLTTFREKLKDGSLVPIYDTLKESVKLPIEIGDTVYMGKFKNKKTVVKDIEWNEKGDLMINGKSALRVRIPKKVKKLKEETDSEWDWVRDMDEFEYFTPKKGERYVWKDYGHGSDEIVIVNVSREDVAFRSVVPLPNDDEDDGTDIETFRNGLKDGWITPIYDTLKEETDSDI